MITLYASGGLGNQLFNYAAARSLADKYKTELIIDVSNYRDQWAPGAERPFLLNRFPVRARFRHMGAVHERHWIGARLLRRIQQDAFVTRVQRNQRELAYFPGFAELGSRTILNGHFIDPRFFNGNEARIKSDLTLADSVLGANSHLEGALLSIRANDSSVAVHVRRGDLLSPGNAWLHLPDMERYYERAFRTIKESLTDACLYVFSDDPEWCAEKFMACNLPMTIISSRKDADPLAEFFLMTQCRHHVIANSAFSWWGAWLCDNDNKRVFAPHIWDLENVLDMKYFVPDRWERISW